ncbi:MAG: hypothetical protein AB1489_38045 [Acidobacteriota bacterium]
MKEKREESIRIKLSPTEREWLDWYCNETSQTLSEFVRGLIRQFRQNNPQHEPKKTAGKKSS